MPNDVEEDSHGTNCAGVIAASANNSYCGVGIAYDAKIGALRILSGVNTVPYHTDAIEAAALSYESQHIDIYSNSWGVSDSGQKVEGPKGLTRQAFVSGVNEGRGGKGSIYVWASGNGGEYFDNCNCDGYANSIYTIAVAAANEDGLSVTFSEQCSAILTSAYSGHDDFENRITTTGTGTGDGKCVDTFGGTSAATPMVTAVIALALQVNPNLTWRDVQHLGNV